MHTATDVPEILVIDDDCVQRSVIAGIGQRAGYRASSAATFEQAAELIRSRRFSCITVDLSLGNRDGIELLRLIGELERVPRVIVISGCEERILSATVRMANAVGILQADSLQKPINLGSLRLLLLAPLVEAGPTNHRAASFAPTIADIALAVERGEIVPSFQPKVRFSDNTIVGCEALARWDSGAGGAVQPDIFIPLAEQCGLIGSMTLSILSQSIAAAREFLRFNPNFVVAVNISAMLISDLSFPEQVEALLVENAVPSSALTLEITESVAMTDVARAMDVLLRLRLKGIGLSIDDFGTGYSSLSALARMPFSELKIDSSFVKHCLIDEDLWKIVRGSVALGHEFHLKVVAEGIEDEQTKNALADIGCDVGQGYYFSPALLKTEFLELCVRWPSHRTVALPQHADFIEPRTVPSAA